MLKKIAFIMVGLFLALPVFAQNLSISAEFEGFDLKASADLKTFKTDVSVNLKLPEAKIDIMLKDNMAPSDVYLAATLVQLANVPVEKVVSEFKANKGKGWGVIAKSLGIKPGSKEFHELKRTMDRMKSTDGGGKGKGKGK